jgi:small subunit ribosomal protein S6e
MAFKICINEPKTKKSWQVEKDIPSLIGLKIGDKFDGSLMGLSGFTLQITGGSDKDGFPMRYDLAGIARKKALLTSGPGFRPTVKGLRRRKYIRGNTISADIVQVNCKIVEGEGDIPLMLGIQPKEKPKEVEKKEGE